MTGRGRTVAVVVVALAGVALAGALAVTMRRGRAELDASVRRDRSFLRMRAGATRPPRPGAETPAARRAACVAGVDGFATAASRTVVDVPRGAGDRGEKLRALLAVSAVAARAEKLAELDLGAPTLPQRMGSERIEGSAGARKAIEPERRACEGKGFATIDDWRPAGAAIKKPAAPRTKGKK